MISRIIQPRFAKHCARCVLCIHDARLWAVLEPRSNTLRRKVLETELVESLRLADRVDARRAYISSNAFPTRSACILKTW